MPKVNQRHKAVRSDPDADFIEAAADAGFTEDQVSFLLDWLARRPHTHTSGEIVIDEGTPEEQTLTDFLEDLEG